MIAPTSRATRFAQSRSRKSAAPSPETSIFANEVSSKSAAVSRQARCSAPIAGDQSRPAQPRGRSDSSPRAAFGSNQFGALPARLLAEGGAELGEPRVGRREPQRPPGLPLVARVLHVVVGLVDLERARERVAARAVGAAEAARVHVPGVERRRALDDPLGDELPIPPAPASPCAQKPAAVQRPRTSVGPRMNSPSGVNASGPLISLTTSASASDGHADDRVLHQLLEPRPVLGEQLAVEVGRDPVERPRRRVALVAAHDQAARLGPEVDEQRRVAHRRHVGRKAGRLRDQVLVRHRHDRDVHAGERADLPREHAAGVDDDLGLDRALVGDDAGHAAALDRDRR